MKRFSALALALALSVFAANLHAADEAKPAANKIKVVIVTGGHGFDQKAFFPLFEGYDDVAYTHAPQTDQSELFEDVSQWPYDVIVLYGMTQQISDKRRENFLKLLDRGVGLVVLHHAMGSFQEWPEFKNIAGGKWYPRELVEDGVKHPRSGYKHGVTLKVQVADREHPITRGIADFEITDETYSGYWVDPKAHVLLTTDEPSSEKAVAWVSAWPKSHICAIVLGHGKEGYANPAFRQLVGQAIRWAAGR